MQPAVRTVCSVNPSLIASYPLDNLEWVQSVDGICSFITTPPFLESFFDQVSEYFPDGKLGISFLSRVIPKQVIYLHKDSRDRGCDTKVLIPLKTNPNAWFFYGSQAVHMELGYAYSIDPNAGEHGTANFGEDDRIHLIFNIVS